MFTFITVHTIAMADDLTDPTTMECKVKTSSVDSEENSKDFKLDMLISFPSEHDMLEESNVNTFIIALKNDAYLKSPFKPPRA
ncbi:MAG: hypothetical protein L3J56_04015 [Bacteroidales bacterium]|nr:hypothetical protein [Bacteroidales bacterium]